MNCITILRISQNGADPYMVSVYYLCAVHVRQIANQEAKKRGIFQSIDSGNDTHTDTIIRRIINNR